MNRDRRKLLKEAIQYLQKAQTIIGDVLSDEEDTFNSLSEYFPDSERAEASEAAIDSMESADDLISDAISSLEEAIA